MPVAMRMLQQYTGQVVPYAALMAATPQLTAAFANTISPILESGAISGAMVPETWECSLFFLEDVVTSDSKDRIATMDFYTDLVSSANSAYTADGSTTSVSLASFSWAITTSLDKESGRLCWGNIVTALVSVACVLIFALPLHRALQTVANIFLVVMSAMGFMGYVPLSYNLVSLCVLVMAIGFAVDYSVRELAPRTRCAAGSG
jgi:hypothetical protein